MKLAGVVEQVDQKTVRTKFGEKPTYSAKVAGQWLKFGFKSHGLSVGDTIDAEYTPGTYGNEVKTFTSTKGTGTPPPAASAPSAEAPAYKPTGGKGSFPIPPLDGQRAIVRQNAVTNARELYCAAAGVKGFAVDEASCDFIIKLARKFEAYSCGDDAMAAATAAIATQASH